ncbi:MAG: CDP-diacylglycerol--serine O-phosphatidyltransferase [Gammaproteobacteria bacterium]|nr:CDP-diacylglycerol--serine O-phosphatidyltransferase [Gammaproteobacteria bacterium]
MNTKQKDQSRPRGIYVLPNLFTISALFAGFYAVVAGMKGLYGTAAIAIFVAMVMDSLDGRVARLTNTQTAFGAELDSISDMVSFGVAPALVIYSWSLHSLGKIGWLAAFIYTVGTALRLARFNTQLDQHDKRYFQGIPCPAAAGVLAGLVWLATDFAITGWPIAIVAAVLTVFMGILMVSNIRFRSFKDLNLKHNVSFLTILFIVLVLVLVAIDPPEILFTIFFLYALSGPVTTLWQIRQKRKLKRKRKAKITRVK